MSDFYTRDIGLAAFLVCIGLEHLQTEKLGNKCVFQIADPLAECRKIESDFYAGAGCTDAQRLCDSYHHILMTIRVARQYGCWRNKEQKVVSSDC